MTSPNAHSYALRQPRLDEAKQLAQHANDADLAAMIGSPNFPHPYTVEHAEAFISKIIATPPPHTHFCITQNDVLIGMVSLVSPIHPTSAMAEVGYWVGRSASGQGAGTFAVSQLVRYAFATFPQLERLEAFVFAENHGSRRVLEKSGFTCEATLKKRMRLYGKVADDVLYALWRS